MEHEFSLPGYEDMELSTQLVIREALRRDLEVEVLDRGENVIRIRQGSKVEYLKQATRTSCDRYVDALLTENKEVTKILLRERGLRVPEGRVFRRPEEAHAAYPELGDRRIVVKPNGSVGGKGIGFLDSRASESAYLAAVDRAFRFDRSILVEEHVEGSEYRFLVIGGRVVGVIHRIPANVEGDGRSSVRELVTRKNDDPRRGRSHRSPLEKIGSGKEEAEVLAAQGLDFDSVPDAGQRVYLRWNSNMSTGGDTVDRTDDVDEGYRQIAVRAADAIGAKICGVDVLASDFRRPPTGDSYVILEVNINPALLIHGFPYRGRARPVEKAVLDLLGF